MECRAKIELLGGGKREFRVIKYITKSQTGIWYTGTLYRL